MRLRRLKRYWHNLWHPVIGEVWELHRVTNEPCTDPVYAPYTITPGRLEALIVSYLHMGYRFVSIDEVVDYIAAGSRFSWNTAKFICVTLDDGYMDSYENAYPILKKHHIPFCVYVTTGFIDGRFQDYYDPPFSLTTQQIKTLAEDPLCTLGAHTVTHAKMNVLSEEEQRREIMDSIAVLESIIQKKATHFTLPLGRFNQYTFPLIQASGVRSNVFGWGGPIRRGVKYNPYFIPRIVIEETKKTF